MCHNCVPDVSSFACDECDGAMRYHPSLQTVLMRTVLTKCLSCGRGVRVGSMEAHVKKSCKGPGMVMAERVILITKAMEVERQRYYDNYAKRKTRRT